MSLKGKTLFITGASRGIGLAIALRAARDGANIAIAAKTETAHPKLEGTTQNPHILMLSPPLDMAEKWFAPYTGYTMAKFGMSMVVLGLAGELRPKGIAVNALWPRTTIATAAIKNLLGGDAIMRRSRTPDILADAAYLIFTKPAKCFTGQFLIDDTFLAGEGVTDFDAYRVDPSQPLSPDFFVPDSSKPPPGVSLAAKT